MLESSFRKFSGGMLITKAIHRLIEWASNRMSLLILSIHSCSSLVRYFSSIWFNFHVLESAFFSFWPLRYRGWLYSRILSLYHQITGSKLILAFDLAGENMLALMRVFNLMNKVGRSTRLIGVLLISHVDISLLPSQLSRPTVLVAVYVIIDNLFLLQLAISCPLKDVIHYRCISIPLMHRGLWLTLQMHSVKLCCVRCTELTESHWAAEYHLIQRLSFVCVTSILQVFVSLQIFDFFN